MIRLHHSCCIAVVLTLVAVVADPSWGRGFGGMHMGGMRMGGMGGMRMGGMGGMRPGGMGGMRPGGMGGMRPGGMRPGGMRPGGMGAMRGMRPGGANFGGGRPGGANFGGLRPGGLNASRPGLGGAAAGRFPGGLNHGFGGMGSGLGGRGEPGVRGLDNRDGPGVRGPGGLGTGGLGGRSGRGDVGKFLGLPSDGGLHSALGGNGLGRDGRGLTRHPDADLRRRGDDVRRDFRGRDFYSPGWYRRYPGAWYARNWAREDLYAAMTWDAMGGYFGYGNADPVYYDYGNTVTYQDNSVYMNGQDMGTSDEYYQQAQDLASTGASAATPDDEQWMPLGVFAMSHDQQTKANLILQLAVNKQGIIRGNYTSTMTNETKPVKGSVDKKTQRAAWTIGDKKDNIVETGIYNLTKDEAPALVHFGKDKTEQWLLVRVKQEDQKQQPQSQDSPF